MPGPLPFWRAAVLNLHMPATRDPASSLYDLPVPWTERLHARLDRRPWWGIGMLYALPVLLMLVARLALVPTLSDAEAVRLLQMRGWAWFYGPEHSPLPFWLGHGLIRLGLPRLAVLLPEALTLWGVLVLGYATARLWVSRAHARLAGASLLLLAPLSLAFPAGDILALSESFAILALVGSAVRTVRRGGWGNGVLLSLGLALCLIGGHGSLLFALVFLLSLGLDRDLRVERQRTRVSVALGCVGGLALAGPYLTVALLSIPGTPLLLLFPPPEMVESFSKAMLHGWSVLAERAVLDLAFWGVAALILAPVLLRPSRAIDLWPGLMAQSCAATVILLAVATVLERGPIITHSGPLACLVLVPLLIFTAMDRLPVAAWRRLAVGTLTAAVALLGPLTLLIEDRFLLPTCATCRADADFKTLSHRIADVAQGPVSIPDPWLAANLWRHRPDLVAMEGRKACVQLQTTAPPSGPSTPLLLPRLRYSGPGIPLALVPLHRSDCP